MMMKNEVSSAGVAMPELRELDDYKKAIKLHFDNYISYWKLSLFHHHNERAVAVLAAIMHADNIAQIKYILFNQRLLFCSEAHIPIDPDEFDPSYIDHTDDNSLANRWAHQLKHKCTKSNLERSGYFRTVMNSLSIFTTTHDAIEMPEYKKNDNENNTNFIRRG